MNLNCSGFTQRDSLHSGMNRWSTALHHMHQSSMLNGTLGKFAPSQDDAVSILGQCISHGYPPILFILQGQAGTVFRARLPSGFCVTLHPYQVTLHHG